MDRGSSIVLRLRLRPCIRKSKMKRIDKVRNPLIQLIFHFIMQSLYLYFNFDDHCSLLQEVSRNPNLTEDDAAVLVAAHIKSKQPKNYGYYRVGAIRDLGGSHKLTPNMDPQLRLVSRQLEH